jgi:putative transposase
MNPAASNSTTIHVWFSTKGRKAFLVDEVRDAVLGLIEDNALKAGVSLIEMEAIEDHVHLLMRVPAGLSLARVMHQIKGASAREILRMFPGISLDMKNLWQKSYGARLVPADQVTAVRRYIRTQQNRPIRRE